MLQRNVFQLNLKSVQTKKGTDQQVNVKSLQCLSVQNLLPAQQQFVSVCQCKPLSGSILSPKLRISFADFPCRLSATSNETISANLFLPTSLADFPCRLSREAIHNLEAARSQCNCDPQLSHAQANIVKYDLLVLQWTLQRSISLSGSHNT